MKRKLQRFSKSDLSSSLGESGVAGGSSAQSFLQNPYYFMFASLAKPDDDAELHWLKVCTQPMWDMIRRIRDFDSFTSSLLSLYFCRAFRLGVIDGSSTYVSNFPSFFYFYPPFFNHSFVYFPYMLLTHPSIPAGRKNTLHDRLCRLLSVSPQRY